MDYIPTYTDEQTIDVIPSYTDSLMHHGIKGQKWGVRRYQNPDGSLTSEGKKHNEDTSNSKKSLAKKIAIGSAIVLGTIAIGYGVNEARVRSKVNKAFTDQLISELDRTHDMYSKIGLTDLSKDTFIKANLKNSKKYEKNKELVKKLVKDQKKTDLHNAKKGISYGSRKLRYALGDTSAFTFGDFGPGYKKSKTDSGFIDPYVKVTRRK